MMELPLEITFDFPDLEYQKNYTDNNCSLTLYHNHFEYYSEFRADEATRNDDGIVDMKMAWKEAVYTCVQTCASRERMIGVEMTYAENAKVWCITISVDGMYNDIKIYFRIRTKAKKLYDLLREYMFGK